MPPRTAVRNGAVLAALTGASGIRRRVLKQVEPPTAIEETDVNNRRPARQGREQPVEIVASSEAVALSSDIVRLAEPAPFFEDDSSAGGEDQEDVAVPDGHQMWSVSGERYYPCEKTVRRLPPGYYVPMADHRSIYLQKTSVDIDELMVFPDSKSEYILGEIQKFWRSKARYDAHGLLWKRGVILTGPPGSGKTSVVQQVANHVIKAGGIAVYCSNPAVTAGALRIIRSIEARRPLVLIMEDIDAIIAGDGEAHLLALLDGELQISNILHIATTNYPEKLDPRFIQRPSRFDDIVEIGMPSREAREVYLKAKNPRLTDEERARWVAGTEGFPLAAIKEVIISVECLGRELEPSLERVAKMLGRKPSSEDSRKSQIGFT
jgi:hypothetical protein